MIGTSRYRRIGPAKIAVMAAAALCAATALPTARALADIFHLRGGDRLDGELVEDLGDVYRIRTVMGVTDVEKERVVRIEPGDPPWRRYDTKKAQTPDTVAGHMELADWCRRNELRAEERRHLERVIELNPDHAGARARLGFEKRAGDWVRPKPPGAPTAEDREARRKQLADERRIQEKITEYTVKVKAILRGRLSDKAGSRGKAFAEGRRLILEMNDPLAIPAIASVLSGGNGAARRVMVEALAQYDVDEATLNLIAAALLDPSKEVRRLAAEALRPRKDERVTRELRAALRSDEEFMLRSAAAALGALKAKSAVRELTAVLSTETVALVPVSRWVSLEGLYTTFSTYQRYRLGGYSVLYRPSCIWAMGPGSMLGTVTTYEYQVVSVYRTEVQEALIEITGKNLGFDAAAWNKWADENDE